NAVVWIQNSNNKVVQQVAKGHASTGIKEITVHTSNMTIYPNPANAAANISFVLDQTTDVHLQVAEMSGRLIANINEGNFHAGHQQLTLNTAQFAAGIYNVTVVAGNSSATQRLSVIK
ncbi:MAG: T9SS type A sorting domain-containing protein, partial [Bacteroidetes bacterium]|nr:T9SS type A sorting domain-containing protein [Bacteroidota bacterium]